MSDAEGFPVVGGALGGPPGGELAASADCFLDSFDEWDEVLAGDDLVHGDDRDPGQVDDVRKVGARVGDLPAFEALIEVVLEFASAAWPVGGVELAVPVDGCVENGIEDGIL
ncbi:hypothetical protein GCM10010430_79040 [Kitasatospora cystarginea]|uniref:Uncharacterized protein n=2 Tax=Streptomycetaceae TaxID=2062 RepID=A0ABN3F1W2_9ACTN